jgi:hypothetical protein
MVDPGYASSENGKYAYGRLRSENFSFEKVKMEEDIFDLEDISWMPYLKL